MKKLFLLFSVIFLACNKKPVVDFSWDPVTPKIGQVISFSNKSTNAKSYNWDFGNGSTSKDKEPQQVYNLVGDYVITLTAYNGVKSMAKTATITVIP